MKKILALMIGMLACITLALSISAAETKGENGIYCSDTNEYGTVNIIEGYDYSAKLSLEQRMVLDNGDGTYSTFPSAYALDYNKDGKKRGERFQYFDPSILNDETGYTYSHASVVRYEIPEGITTIHHDDRANINFNSCKNTVEVTFPSTLVTFTKSNFLDSMTSLKRVDMSACTSLTKMANSMLYKCPAIDEVILGPALTSLPNNTFQESGIVTVTIPTSITSIGQYAFYNCKSLNSVTMHDGVTSIGSKMFQYSTIKEFTVPQGVTSIPQDCFHGCTSLTSVTMSDNVTSMAGYIFNGCTALSSVRLSDNITTVNSYTFSGCTSLAEITLPSKLTTVPGAMFRGCSALKSIVIPNSVTSIGNQAFYNCSSLASVVMSNAVQSIGKEAFAGCKLLAAITLPNTLTFIDQYVFSGCSALTSAIFEEGASLETELVGTFQNCSSLATVKLPDGITGIGYNCFYKCSALTTIEGGIPSSVTTLAQSAFNNCTLLADLGTLPDGLTYIGQDAFNSCKALTSVTLPNSLETIYNYAFTKCSGLVSINIPDSVTYLGTYAFNECTALTTVSISENSPITGALKGTFNSCSALTSFIIPRGVTAIDENTFRGCKALTDIGGPIPSGVTLIGKDCFNGCPLTEIALPSGLLEIKDYAFTNCASLTEISIPDTVTYLGYFAFNGCSSLTTASISENSQIANPWRGTFNNCKVLTSIHVPSGVTKFEYDVFSYCNAISSITFGEGLIEITAGNNFRNCSSLKSIKLPNTLTTIADNNFGGCTALEEVRLGDSLTHLGAGNLTLKALKRVYIPASLTSVGTHLLGYTNANDSSKNITFVFTGSFAEAQALRALVKADTANANNASKFYDSPLLPSSEYDVTEEPSGYHFVYNFSKCVAFYDSHSLEAYNPCMDKCAVCLHLYAVSSPVHDFEGGASIVYSDFAKEGIKTNVCQREGCAATDGSSSVVPPIFTFLGYAIYEPNLSFCVDYTVDIDALLEYEGVNGVTLSYGMVGAYTGHLSGGAPLDPTTAKPVDISSTGDRIFYHNVRRSEKANMSIILTNIDKERYETEFYICLFIFDGKEVKYLTSEKSTSMPDPISYAKIRGPVEVVVDGMSYSTEKETTLSADRLRQMAESAAAYNTTTMSDSDVSSIKSKVNTVITGGSLIGWNNAAKLLQHFMDGTGEQYTLNMNDFLEDSNNKAFRDTDINRALRAAEQLAREGESLTLNQLSENLHRPSDDWYYAVGTYFSDVDLTNLTVTVDENGVKHYSADIKYIATDFYNWDKNNTTPVINKKVLFFTITGPSPAELYRLHAAGLAREFLTYGEITYQNVTWTEGQTVADLGI